jgi:hypothetical protein
MYPRQWHSTTLLPLIVMVLLLSAVAVTPAAAVAATPSTLPSGPTVHESIVSVKLGGRCCLPGVPGVPSVCGVCSECVCMCVALCE